MKNIIKILSIFVLASVTFSSCFDELLEPVPQTAISDLTAFDTKDRVVGQVNGLYAAVKSGAYLGGRYQIYNDIRGDDFLNLQSNGVTGLQTWTHNLSPSTSEVVNLWQQVYFVINRINLFLEGLEGMRADPAKAGILTDDEYNQFRGEALALRGMAYFHLSMLYARPYNQNPSGPGLILRLTANRTSADNDMARSTVAETYAQILSDLNTAEPLLPLSHTAGTANSVLNVSRMHRNTVIALKTRVYLHMNNYQAVLTEGNKIVPAAPPFVAGSGVADALAPTFAGIFAAPYTTFESIFSIPMTSVELPGTQNQLGHYFTPPPAGNNEYPINQQSPVWTNLTDFPEDDARRQLTVKNTVSGADHIWIYKYPTFPHTDYAPVIRYAEVVLNVAEAEARQNGVNARAVALLNAVYERSNPGRTYSVGDFASADAFVDRVMRERNMEFLGEGIRNMDIMRKVAPFEAKATAQAVPPNSPAYVWPISEREMNTNNLVVQN